MSRKVLVVDDDKIVILLHQRILKRCELFDTPLCFEHAGAALDYLREQSGDSEQYLIFLDLNMPVMDGWGLLDAIQSGLSHLDISVVVVTSSIDPDERERASQYPQVIDFVVKPLSIPACNRVGQLV